MFGFLRKSLVIIVGLTLTAFSLSAGAMANVPDSPPLDPIEIAQPDPGGGPSLQTVLPDIVQADRGLCPSLDPRAGNDQCARQPRVR